MNQIELNNLTQYSLWPSRLLGLESWKTPNRTIQKVESEYNLDKYNKCLNYYLSNTDLNIADVRKFQYGNDNKEVCISVENTLHQISLHEANFKYSDLLLSNMRTEIEKCQTVVELGCGYGYNLWHLANNFENKISWRGGEYSQNAINLASMFDLQKSHDIEVKYFNFYDSKAYQFLSNCKPPIGIFTSHAIEQLPDAATVFKTLLEYRENIQAVFHFEPVYELYDQTLLGMLRRSYTEANDYNRNLLSELQKMSNIKICNIDINILGSNPLNPTSVIHWKFI
jgi:hypothetical protein